MKICRFAMCPAQGARDSVSQRSPPSGGRRGASRGPVCLRRRVLDTGFRQKRWKATRKRSAQRFGRCAQSRYIITKRKRIKGREALCAPRARPRTNASLSGKPATSARQASKPHTLACLARTGRRPRNSNLRALLRSGADGCHSQASAIQRSQQLRQDPAPHAHAKSSRTMASHARQGTTTLREWPHYRSRLPQHAREREDSKFAKASAMASPDTVCRRTNMYFGIVLAEATATPKAAKRGPSPTPSLCRRFAIAWRHTAGCRAGARNPESVGGRNEVVLPLLPYANPMSVGDAEQSGFPTMSSLMAVVFDHAEAQKPCLGGDAACRYSNSLDRLRLECKTPRQCRVLTTGANCASTCHISSACYRASLHLCHLTALAAPHPAKKSTLLNIVFVTKRCFLSSCGRAPPSHLGDLGTPNE